MEAGKNREDSGGRRFSNYHPESGPEPRLRTVRGSRFVIWAIMLGVGVAQSTISAELFFAAPETCDLLPQRLSAHSPLRTLKTPERACPSISDEIWTFLHHCKKSRCLGAKEPRALDFTGSASGLTRSPRKRGGGAAPSSLCSPQIRGGPGNLPGMGVETVRPIFSTQQLNQTFYFGTHARPPQT